MDILADLHCLSIISWWCFNQSNENQEKLYLDQILVGLGALTGCWFARLSTHWVSLQLYLTWLNGSLSPLANFAGICIIATGQSSSVYPLKPVTITLLSLCLISWVHFCHGCNVTVPENVIHCWVESLSVSQLYAVWLNLCWPEADTTLPLSTLDWCAFIVTELTLTSRFSLCEQSLLPPTMRPFFCSSVKCQILHTEILIIFVLPWPFSLGWNEQEKGICVVRKKA